TGLTVTYPIFHHVVRIFLRSAGGNWGWVPGETHRPVVPDARRSRGNAENCGACGSTEGGGVSRMPLECRKFAWEPFGVTTNPASLFLSNRKRWYRCCTKSVLGADSRCS